MKYILRIPTKEQYAYIEIEHDWIDASDALETYNAFTRLIQGGTGLPVKEWTVLKKAYFTRKFMEGDPGDLQKLNPYQRFWVDETKKTIKALKEEQFEQEINGEVEQEKAN